MSEIFPKTSAGVPNSNLGMHAVANKFIVKYRSSGLSCLEDVSRITFGRLGAFLHLALFMAWSHKISNNQKPPIHFPADCLGRSMLFQLYTTLLDGRSTVRLRHHPLQQTRGLYLSGLLLRRLSMDALQKVWIF
jgi:hypothetical protein